LIVFTDPTVSPTLEQVSTPLDKASTPLDYVWSLLKTMSIVKNDVFTSEGYTKLHERAKIARTKKYHSDVLYSVWRVSFVLF
jgi:hypothetical protein